MKTRHKIPITTIIGIIAFILISFAIPNLHKIYDSCEMTQDEVLQFAIGYQWTNGFLYIDNAECIWKLFGVIPIVHLLSEEEIAQPEPASHPVPEGSYIDKNTYVYSINEAESYLNYTLGTPYIPEGTEIEKIKISNDKRKATIYYSNGLEVKHNPMGINFNNTHYIINPEREAGKVFYDFGGTFAEGYEIDEPNRPHYSTIIIHRDDRIYVRATMETGLDELLKMIEPMDLNVPHVQYTPIPDYVMGAPEPEPEPIPEPEHEPEIEPKHFTIEELLIENQIDYLPDQLVVTGGPTIRGDPGCGAVIDIDSQTHWFGIDSLSEPKKLTLFSENPNQCEVNTSSCFCNAQMKLTALTLDELDYFTLQEEKKYAEILIDYLEKENINRTPKFQIGKFNLNYTDSFAVGYCGELWGINTYDFFDGAFVKDIVKDYGISKEISPLCAINNDTQYFGKMFSEE